MEKTKNILSRFKTKKLVTFFIIFGFVMSMLMVSFNISFIGGLNEEEDTLEKLGAPNAYKFYFGSETANILGKDTDSLIDNLEDNLDKHVGAYITDFLLNLDKAEADQYFEGEAGWFGENGKWNPPLLEGRYYTREEILERKNVVVIGQNLKKYMNDDGKTIGIYGKNYEVVGIAGIKDKPLKWDMFIFFPLSIVSEEMADNIGGDGNIIVYSSKNDTLEQIDKFIAGGNSRWDKFESSEPETLSKRKIRWIDLDINFLFITIIVYIAAISQAMAIMTFWIDNMRFEIGLRKALGHTNFQIGKLVYGEIFTITLIAYIISIIIQLIINIFIKSVLGVLITLRFENLTLGMVVIVITSLTTSIYPIIKSFEVQPTEAMKL
ncbi:ABC transporter permease [Anaerosalibacter bizertensis]|uniref:ABC transporter permease n=2 Tax=Anaerosalibacter bizertensis TaxID=932217 RepID=A0A844FH11_9FIRM|nr:ABC transporter permease [Anaerosalibacter bizertensis]MSS43279.1 ABC transporter permease [Anaerosalibacter bizertensis]